MIWSSHGLKLVLDFENFITEISLEYLTREQCQKLIFMWFVFSPEWNPPDHSPEIVPFATMKFCLSNPRDRKFQLRSLLSWYGPQIQWTEEWVLLYISVRIYQFIKWWGPRWKNHLAWIDAFTQLPRFPFIWQRMHIISGDIFSCNPSSIFLFGA